MMKVFRSATRVSTHFAAEVVKSRYPLLKNKHNSAISPNKRTLSTKKSDTNKEESKTMVDPKRVVSYEDMLKVIFQPKKVIIDVRNTDEVNSTGKIPSSINIPLGHVQDVLSSMSDADFKKQYQRDKPSSSDELIFYCRSGRRSSEALDRALKLGYTNSKSYNGSWDDWSSRQK